MSELYKVVADTPGGWMEFVAAHKAAHPTAILDYKVLMQLYIRGKQHVS